MSCSVTAGDSTGAPAVTLRTAATISAGELRLRRKPAAPADSALRTCSSALKGRQHHDGRRIGAGPEYPGCLQAVHAGHPDIHQHQVGLGACSSTSRMGVRPSRITAA